jgi:hypothetical protein
MKQQSLAGEFDRERPGAPVLPAQVLAFRAGRGVVAAELEARSGNDAEPLQELAHPPAAEGMGR